MYAGAVVTKYALIAALLGVLGLSGVLVTTMARNSTLRADNAALRLSLGACEADAINIEEDKETDDAIDNIPDDALRDAPDRWLLPPGAGGIY